MAFIGSTVSGGESLKGWAGTQVPALFFCAQQGIRKKNSGFKDFAHGTRRREDAPTAVILQDRIAGEERAALFKNIGRAADFVKAALN